MLAFTKLTMAPRHKSSEDGFTLIEIAVTTFVIGILVVAAIPLYSLYLERVAREDTLITQKRVDSAINSFVNLRGRYPCPARYNAKPSDSDYGIETSCTGSAEAPGSCVNGICYETSVRQIDVDGTMVYPRVERGALPFVTLGLSEDMSYDSYGGRFSYAVTEILTDKVKFRSNRGGISIVDGASPTPNSLVTPEGSAHYFVFSHGPNRVGAYNMDGHLLNDCNGPLHDNENCNTSSSNPEATYRHALYSEALPDPSGGVSTRYDDFVDFVGIGRQPLWEYAENGGNLEDTINPHDAVYESVIVGRDAVLDSNLPSGSIQVEGDAKVQQARSETICDGVDSALCFESALIGADLPGDERRLQCDTTGAPKGVSNQQINCGPIVTGTMCNDGEYLAGVDANGMPVCRAFQSCATEPRNICGTTHWLPDNAASGRRVTLTGGDSYSQTFACTGGNWVDGVATGVCDCTPSTQTTPSGCGANMSGQVVTTTVTTCPYSVTTSVDRSACTCVESSREYNGTCAAGFVGTPPRYRETVSCVNNTPQGSTTTIDPGTCACEERTRTGEDNCLSGFVSGGKRKWEQSTSCPNRPNSYGPKVYTTDNCVCRPSYTKPVPCNSSRFNEGTITQKCSFDCSGGIHTSAKETCVEETNTCACKPGSNVTYRACPAGYTGQIKRTTTTTCTGTGINVNTVEDDSGCAEEIRQCTYVKTSEVPYSTSDSRSGPRCGTEVCSYSAKNNPCTKTFCHQSVGGLTYDIYTARCE